MNSLGLSILLNMGCVCTKESVHINGNKYYILDQIEGGFSTVLITEKASNRKKYAVKKIICHDMEAQRKGMQEAEYYSVLKHKNIIYCLEHVLVEDANNALHSSRFIFYMVFPYYPRGTLNDDLRRKEECRKRYSHKEVLHIFSQICDGLKVLHDYQPIPLAHHDIKPTNILLMQDNTPIIMDLGSTSPAIVRISNNTEACRIQEFASEMCTMPYRAPELFNVESNTVIDQRTDIWSLGCLLFAMCYYKSPFDIVYERGDSIALAVMSSHIVIPDTYYKKEITDLILSMLKVNPAERPFINQVIEQTRTIHFNDDELIC